MPAKTGMRIQQTVISIVCIPVPPFAILYVAGENRANRVAPAGPKRTIFSKG
jgi:hypothetical protein